MQQAGLPRSFTDDSLKRLLSAANPESGTVTYVYDASGNMSTRTDALSKVTTNSYDGMTG